MLPYALQTVIINPRRLKYFYSKFTKPTLTKLAIPYRRVFGSKIFNLKTNINEKTT